MRTAACLLCGRAVALRKESVDRNIGVVLAAAVQPVALRKESVDRNLVTVVGLDQIQVSLSARRAWIEISDSRKMESKHRVALRKESVDRNPDGGTERRSQSVALRKESVDRNLSFHNSIKRCLSRSPQGERG